MTANKEIVAEARQRIQAEQELAALAVAIKNQRDKIGRAHLRVQETRNSFDGYSARFGRTKYDSDRAKMEESKASFEQAQADLRGVKDMLADMEKRHNGMQAQLNRAFHVEASHIAQSQKDMIAQRAELSNLKAAIENQEDIILKAQSREETTQDIVRRRQNLLAAAALGEDKTQELAAVDQELAAALKVQDTAATEKSCLADTARHTIEGLKKRADEMKAAIELSAQVHKQLLSGYILAQIKNLAADYTKAAHALREQYLELAALNEITAKIGIIENPNIFFIRNHVGPMDLVIPLPDVETWLGNIDAERYLKSNYQRDDLTDVIAEVKNEFALDGIELSF